MTLADDDFDWDHPDFQTENYSAWVRDERLHIYNRSHSVSLLRISLWAELTLDELGELADLRAQWWNDEHV